MNAIVFWGEKGEKSEGRGLFWYCLRYAVNDDKMILPAAIVHDKFIIILLQYIIFCDVCYALYVYIS